MAGNNQYDNPPSWMGGRGSNQYDTRQNRSCDPGAAFLGPRLWDQPINLPFQLFPSDSQQQQQQDVSKQNIFAQQQQSYSQGNFCSQSFSQQQNCYQQSFTPQNKCDSQSQKIEELSHMFGRTSLKNK